MGCTAEDHANRVTEEIGFPEIVYGFQIIPNRSPDNAILGPQQFADALRDVDRGGMHWTATAKRCHDFSVPMAMSNRQAPCPRGVVESKQKIETAGKSFSGRCS
jgi:hypothetical protein